MSINAAKVGGYILATNAVQADSYSIMQINAVSARCYKSQKMSRQTAMQFLVRARLNSVPLAVTHVHVPFNVAALHSLTRTFMQADVFEELLTNSRLEQGNTSLTIVPPTLHLMDLAGNTHFPHETFILKTVNRCFSRFISLACQRIGQHWKKASVWLKYLTLSKSLTTTCLFQFVKYVQLKTNVRG